LTEISVYVRIQNMNARMIENHLTFNFLLISIVILWESARSNRIIHKEEKKNLHDNSL